MKALGVAISMLLLAVVARGQQVLLDVDATDAPNRLVHTRMTVPAKSGQVTLIYPKWIPGEHSPSGPINDLVDLKITSNGKPVPWRRDPEEMHAIKINVPAGADQLIVEFNCIIKDQASAKLLHLAWNRVLLYPGGASAADLKYAATLDLPIGWKY